MLDANSEIARLRQRLRFKGLSDNVIDSICDEAAAEISDTTSNLLADAMNEAVNVGGNVQSVEFIDELRAVRHGSIFQIATDSGKTDFSQAPFPMLPKLLKNAKVSKDGSLYKVIPIKQKGSSNNDSASRATDAAMRNISEARKAAKTDKFAKEQRNYASMDAMKGMSTVAAMQAISKSRTPQHRDNSGPVINFRTASSKQDANTQWVHPGKKADLSGALNNINADLQDAIDKAIDEIIRRLEELYW